MANNNSPLQDEKQAEREAWFKLIIKIISWKEALKVGKIPQMDKISTKEWGMYYKRTIQISVPFDKDKALKTLKEDKALIEEHGGFE